MTTFQPSRTRKYTKSKNAASIYWDSALLPQAKNPNFARKRQENKAALQESLAIAAALRASWVRLVRVCS